MTSASPDGRATRWQDHNVRRRRELVESTLRAIRKHGAGVGMDELASEAGTSKTVFYRHFGDRAGLYEAVVGSVHDFIHANLEVPLSSAAASDPGALVAELTDAYLAVVERDPEIYQFVTTRPGDATTDPVAGITMRIGDEVADALRVWLARQGLDTAPALTWGHGIVGFIWAVADKWITTGKRRPRADIVAFVGRLFAPAFAAQTAPLTQPTEPATETGSPR